METDWKVLAFNNATADTKVFIENSGGLKKEISLADLNEFNSPKSREIFDQEKLVALDSLRLEFKSFNNARIPLKGGAAEDALVEFLNKIDVKLDSFNQTFVAPDAKKLIHTQLVRAHGQVGRKPMDAVMSGAIEEITVEVGDQRYHIWLGQYDIGPRPGLLFLSDPKKI